MDEQTNPQVSVQNPPQQNQQVIDSSGPSKNTPQNSQQQVALQPEKKKLKWWMWVILALVVIGLGVGLYFFWPF